MSNIADLGGFPRAKAGNLPNGVLGVPVRKLGSWDISAHRGLFVTHPDFAGVVSTTSAALDKRGFAVRDIGDAAAAVAEIAALAETAAPGQRLFVYLGVHGGGIRQPGDMTAATGNQHIFQPQTGQFSWGDVAGHFRTIVDRGAELIVFDGSCDGGESVLAAMGERYAVLATTAMDRPGSTGEPNPGDVMAQYPAGSHFGLSWGDSDAAGRLAGYVPFREYQKIYRNDDTSMACVSQFVRSGMLHLRVPGDPYTMEAVGCHLAKCIDPARNEGDGTLDAYVSWLQAGVDGYAPAIAQFLEMLGDADLVRRAGRIYAQHFERVWRNLFRDQGWDLRADPVRSTKDGVPVEPLRYEGESGFTDMVTMIILTIAGIQAEYGRQIELLREIDAEVARTGILRTALVDAVHPIDRSSAAQMVLANHRETEQSHFALQVKRVGSTPADVVRQLARTSNGVLHGTSSNPGQRVKEAKIPPLAWREWGPLHQSRVPELVEQLVALRGARGLQVQPLWYLQTIVEDAISKAQETSAQPADVMRF